jgi:hypothetical protein
VTTLKFSDLNPVGRAIIVVVAALTAAVAAVAFATSYGALYAFIKGTGLYDDTGRYADRLNQAWPLLLDAMFIIAQLAAILGGILRGPRGWPILTMLLSGSLTVWFNLQHAGADPGRRLAAALPPVFMMLAFEIDVQIVRWVMHALGKPMDATTTPLLPAGYQLPSPGAVPGALYRPDGAPSGVVPPAVGPPPQPVPTPWWPYGQMPSPTSSEKPQNGQAGVGGNGLHGGGDQADATKREQVEAYLARLGSDQVDRLTARQLTADLTDQGMDVSERYVARLFDQWNATRRHASTPRKRGSGPRPPRR